MHEKNQGGLIPAQVGCVYVLSTDDVDMIHCALSSDADWFWELLEGRRVEFPNPYFRRAAEDM